MIITGRERRRVLAAVKAAERPLRDDRRAMPQRFGVSPAKIVVAGPNNEPQFTDHRYWCSLAMVANGDSDPLSPIAWEDAPADMRTIVKADNVAEVAAGTHNVPADSIVMLYSAFDMCVDPGPVQRFWFTHGGTGGGPLQIVGRTGTGFPYTYRVQRVRAADGSVEGPQYEAHAYCEDGYDAQIINSYDVIPVGTRVWGWWEPWANRFGLDRFGDFASFEDCA